MGAVVFAIRVAFVGGGGGGNKEGAVPLTPGLVYATLTLLNIVQQSVTKMIPNAVMGMAECRISGGRIQKFLELPSFPADGSAAAATATTAVTATGGNGTDDDDGHGSRTHPTGSKRKILTLDKVTCHWDWTDANDGIDDATVASTTAATTEISATTTTTTTTTSQQQQRWRVALRDISLELTSGQLYFLTGEVGSGKSALLMALAGELPPSSGRIERHGGAGERMAYASQEPWIMNGTIHQNIVFGRPYDSDLYTRTIDTCALRPDLRRLPDGDETIVGDSGMRLSGGQRTRVGLARALYRRDDADLFLLGDPLGAVDFETRSRIFRTVRDFCMENDKCVVLATHHYEFAGKSHFVSG